MTAKKKVIPRKDLPKNRLECGASTMLTKNEYMMVANQANAEGRNLSNFIRNVLRNSVKGLH
jgi:hypothetical protein